MSVNSEIWPWWLVPRKWLWNEEIIVPETLLLSKKKKKKKPWNSLSLSKKTKMRAFIILLLFFLPPTLGAYDYYQHILKWAPTYCTGQKNCRIPSPLNFTIHGLWSSDAITSKIPACSSTGVLFNLAAINS